MIIREMITLLGFRVNQAGVREYDRTTTSIVNRSTVAANTVSTALGVLAANFVQYVSSMAGQAAASIVRAGDSVITASNLINSGLDGVEGGAEVLERLYQAARITGVEVTASASAFSRLAPATRELGFTAADTVELIDGMQRALAIAGAGASESSAVMRQFGQAIGSGVLRGDEFNSLMENSGKLMRVFAEELGKPISELRKMAEDGKLTADVVLPAMQRATRRLATEYEGMERTATSAWAGLKVTINQLFGELMRTMGASRTLGELIRRVSEFFEALRRGIPMLRAWLDSIGGLQRAVELFGAIALAVLIMRLRTALAATVALTRAVALLGAKFLLPAAAIIALGLLLDDLMVWMRGGDSVLGNTLGPFQEFAEKLPGMIRQAMTDAFGEMGGAAFDGVVRVITALRDIFRELPGAMREAGEALFGWFKDGMDSLEASIGSVQVAWGTLILALAAGTAVVMRAVTALRGLQAARAAAAGAGAAGAAPAAAGAAPAASPAAAAGAGAAARTSLFGRAAGLLARASPWAVGAGIALTPSRVADGTLTGNPEIMRQLEAMAAPANQAVPQSAMRPTQNNTTNNEFQADIEITVTAPAFTPEELASRVQDALQNSTRQMIERMGRSINGAMPRAEAPAQ